MMMVNKALIPFNIKRKPQECCEPPSEVANTSPFFSHFSCELPGAWFSLQTISFDDNDEAASPQERVDAYLSLQIYYPLLWIVNTSQTLVKNSKSIASQNGTYIHVVSVRQCQTHVVGLEIIIIL